MKGREIRGGERDKRKRDKRKRENRTRVEERERGGGEREALTGGQREGDRDR